MTILAKLILLPLFISLANSFPSESRPNQARIRTLHKHQQHGRCFPTSNRRGFSAPQASTSELSIDPLAFRITLPTNQNIKRAKDEKDLCASKFYREKIQEKLLQAGVQHSSSPLGGFQFYFPHMTDDEEESQKGILELCRSLPGNKLFIAVAQWDTTTEKSMGHQDILSHETIKRAVALWKLFGNERDKSKPTTFRISCKSPNKRVSSRSTTTRKDLSDWFSATMQWKVESRSNVDPTFSFQLTLEDKIYYLELLGMDRTWPLQDPFTVPSTSRIESFVVAKSANIQPNNVVWDPFCKRGTFLIEAAKYWPTAYYHGTEANMGHLEHCQMNAKSTSTSLHLHHAQTTGVSTDQLQQALRTTDLAHVDKILTCLPSDQSIRQYYNMLQSWTQVLCPSATMVFLVDLKSLPAFIEAINELREHFFVSMIRQPPFLWGKRKRSTVVIVEHTSSAEKRTRRDILDWEKAGIEHISNEDSKSTLKTVDLWARMRSQTIPWLVPCTKSKAPRSKIRLRNGKFL